MQTDYGIPRKRAGANSGDASSIRDAIDRQGD